METALEIFPKWQTMTREDVLSAFMNGRKETTIMAYKQDIADFAAFVGMTERDAVETLLASGPGNGNLMALSYRSFLQSKGLQPTTVNRRLATLRSLTKFARLAGWINWKLEVSGLKTGSYRDTSGPGSNAYRRMLAQTECRNITKAIRDKAILRLLHDLGLRRGELVALDVADVDVEGATVSILGKGRLQKQRLTLPAPTKEALSGWLDVRGREGGPLFTNLDHAGKGDGRLTGTSVYRLIRSLGEGAGVKTRPHGIRHLAITKAVRAAQKAGFGIEEVLDFSRHADLKTLQIYIDRDRDAQGQIATLVAQSVE